MEKETIKLIDGTYKVEEAGEILLSVLGDKIRFHNFQMLGADERQCDDAYNSENRLRELNADKKKVEELLKLTRNRDLKLKIRSEIIIDIVAAEKS